MRRHELNRILMAGVLAGTSLAGVGNAFAQSEALDKTQLIESLRKEGLGILLKHMVETEPMKDPVLKKQVLINQLLLDYDVKIADAVNAQDPSEKARLRAEALVNFDQAADERRALIKQFPDHEQRPLWQTDLAEMMLFEYLRVIKNNATEFYEFGVPTAEQRIAFESVVPEMLEALSDADARLFTLQRDLPLEKDHVSKRVNTLIWERMMEQYYKLRTQFFLAHAAYYATLLPPDHPFWKKVGNDPLIPAQKKTYAEEIKRLLEIEVINRLDKFGKDIADPNEIRRPSLALIGRAQSKQKNFDESLRTYELVISAGTADIYDLICRMAKVNTLESMKHPGEALDQVNDVAGHQLVTSSLLMRLLYIDLYHRLLLNRAKALPADKQVDALTAAYDPYNQFLNDPALGDLRGVMRDYVFRRWESSIPPGTDLSRVPPMVVAAVGEMARRAGLELNNTAGQTEDKLKASQLRAQARAKFDRAIQVNSDLLKRAALSKGVIAMAKYNLGVSQYWLDPQDTNNQLHSARSFLDIAEESPEEPMAEEAITYSVQLLRPMYLKVPRAQGVEAMYHGTVNTLFDKFGGSAAANQERVFYAEAVLIPASRFARAAEVVRGVPAGHGQYFYAQTDLLNCLQQVYRRALAGKGEPAAPVFIMPVAAAPAGATTKPSTQPATAPSAPPPPTDLPVPDPKVAGQAVVDEATRLVGEADNANPGPDVEPASVKLAGGTARLVLADMAVEYQNDISAALGFLDGFETRYAGETDLIRIMQAKRIVLLYKARKLDDAVAEANRMMKAFPDDAAIIIDNVLTELISQINALRSQIATDVVPERVEKAKADAEALSKAALSLAELEVNWAEDPAQKKTDDQKMPIKVQLVRTLLMAQQVERAAAIIKPLYVKYPKEGIVADSMARAQFALAAQLLKKDRAAGEKMLTDEVAPLLNRLISGARADANGRYPEFFWHAWRDRLTMIELLYLSYQSTGSAAGTNPYRQQIGDVSNRVGTLRAVDPNLGGEIYKGDFERLERKWGGPGAGK